MKNEIMPVSRVADEQSAMAEYEPMEREKAVAQIEGRFPYQRERYLIEIDLCLRRAEMSYIEAGKMFLVMKEREPHGEFMRILEERFPQYSISHIYKLMQAALFLEEHPRIAEKVPEMPKTSVLELCSLPDEDLDEFEEKGVLAGKNLDEISKMSSRELREFARGLKYEKEKLVEESVKEVTAAQDAIIKKLREENKELKERLPENTDTGRYLDVFNKLDELLKEFFHTSVSIKLTKDLYDDLPTQGKIILSLRAMQQVLDSLRDRWEAFQSDDPHQSD
jgi:hypothetical protein